MVTPLRVMLIFPVAAPTGTIAVMLVAVAAVVVAVTSLNLTTLSLRVVLKFVPVIVIVLPTAPLSGLNSVMEGEGSTMKSEGLSIVIPFNITDIFPVVAPAGTVVVILVVVEVVTVVEVPLNFTWLLVGIVLKLVPLIITVAPWAAPVGLKSVITGVANTV